MEHKHNRDKCPCCGYLTLPKKMHPDMPEWQIGILCHWEDDGQDDRDANRVLGGPNGRYSLTEARTNFKKYLVMYSPDNDTRIIPGDWLEEIATKKSLIALFEEINQTLDEDKINVLWEEVFKTENELDNLLKQKISIYEQRIQRTHAK